MPPEAKKRSVFIRKVSFNVAGSPAEAGAGNTPATPPANPTPSATPPPPAAEAGNNGQQGQQAESSIDFEKLDDTTKAYIKSLRDEAKQYRLEKKAAKEAADAAEAEKLKAKGDWQKVAETAQKQAEEFKPYKEKYEALEALITKQVEARVKALPENVRKMIPDKYNILDKWDWLEANAGNLVAKPAPNLDAGAGNKGSIDPDKPDAARLKDIAQRFRLNYRG